MNMSQNETIWPRYTPLGIFSDNVAHSNADTGLQVDNGALPDGTSEDSYYSPRQNPAYDSPPVVAEFKNLTAYKQRNLAIWLRGDSLLVTGAMLADNGGGAIFAASETFLQNSLVVGESDNKGTPGEGEPAGLDGRSLPQPWEPATPIVGYSFYDGRVGAQNVTFANFQSNSQRPAGALSYLRSNANPINVRNFAEGLSFLNANQVYIENPHAAQDGDKAAIFLDSDGSVTGTAGQYVVVNNPFLVDSACSFKQAWNTYACSERYVFFSIAGDGDQAVAPLVLKREDGVEGALAGMGSGYAAISMVPGRNYTVKYDSNVARSVQLDFQYLNQGDWIGLTMPYPNGNFTVYRDAEHNQAITAAQTLAEFNSSSGEKYFYDKGTGLLHLKAMPQNGNDWARINVAV
jgi:cell migration-inducing and hyaluronan-binding protein